MTRKIDEPEALDEASLEQITGGAEVVRSLGGLRSDGELVQANTVSGISKASLIGGKDDVLIQNIGFPDDQGGSKIIKGK